MTITPAQIQAAFTSLNTILTEIETVEGTLSMFLPSNVTAAFAVVKAFQPTVVAVEQDIVDVVTKIEAAMATPAQ